MHRAVSNYAVVFIALVHAAFASLLSAQAPITTPAPVVAACEPECTDSSGFWFKADYLNWTPHTRGLDYAIFRENPLPAGMLVGGQVNSLGFDSNSGVRGELGYATNAGWGIVFGYTNFDTEAQASLDRGVGRLWSTSGVPAGSLEANTASAEGRFDLDIFDIEARYPVLNHRFIAADLFGGLRWASIDQHLHNRYDGRSYVNGNLIDDLSVEAFGVRFGGEGHWRMAHGFSLFTRGAVGLLYGQMENTRFEDNNNGNTVLVDVSDTYEQPIVNIDAAVGFSYSTRRATVSLGYELSNWSNAQDRLRFVDNYERGAIAPSSHDILLEGIFVRLGSTW